jgi:hypothetical protein
VPVLAGIAFFALFFLGLYFAARFINHKASPTSKIGNTVFEVGHTSSLARGIKESGPMLFPDLKSPDGVRSIVLDHAGSDDATGWQVYYAYPADSTPSCLVTHVKKTRTFTDCNGRTLQVEQLDRPTDVHPLVENRVKVYIDLRGVTNG